MCVCVGVYMCEVVIFKGKTQQKCTFYKVFKATAAQNCISATDTQISFFFFFIT